MIKYMEESDCQSRNYQKLTKPLIEKRRRARINLCLMQLKDMIIDSGRYNIENPKCKYEKADILEVTVEYLQHLHQMQNTQQLDESKSEQSFTAGYIECAKQVEQFLKYNPLSDNDHRQESELISQKLLLHLQNFCQQKQNCINNNNDRLIGDKNKDNIENKNNINHNNEVIIDRNSLTPNSFSVIHHTSEYSGDSPSTISTISPIQTPELTKTSTPSSPFLSELDMRPNNLGLYGNERNGHCYQVMDVDGVWRPW